MHADALQRLTAEAKSLEQRKDLPGARERWESALCLLPANSAQAVWIQEHLGELQTPADSPANLSEKRLNWVKRFGPLAPVLLFLTKAKFLLTALFKLKFLFSLAAFLGFYWALYGAKFGIGFAAIILLHEMGHYIDVRRRGLPAEMPVFLPGLGAYVRWQALGVSVQTRAFISLAGPCAGLLVALACFGLWKTTGAPIWAALAQAGAWLNLLNLIPVWILDGGQAVLALNRQARLSIAVVAAALALTLHQNTLYLVAAGAVWRMFTKDVPEVDGVEQNSMPIALYFNFLLLALTLVLLLVPGRVSSMR